MQGKGIVKFFLVVMGLIAIAQFLFLLPTKRVERQADDYAQRISSTVQGDEKGQRDAFKSARTDYLDSVSNETVFSLPLLKDYTYQDLKAQQLAYGLDLSGGMSVVLQVNLREYILSLSRKSEDSDFTQALDLASQRLANAQDDYIALFADAWQEVKGDKKLASIFSANPNLREQVGLNTSDGEIIDLLRERADETVELTYGMLRRRIDQLGVVQPNVTLDADRDMILVELPGIDNPARAREFLQAAAELEFYDVHRMVENGINFFELFQRADEVLLNKQLAAAGDSTGIDLEPTYRYDTTFVADADGFPTAEVQSVDTVEIPAAAPVGPLLSKLIIGGDPGYATAGYALKNDRDEVLEMLADPDVARLFPRSASFHFQREAIEPVDGSTIPNNAYNLVVIKKPANGEAPITGEAIVDARAEADQVGEMGVGLTMNTEGAREWARWSQRASADNKRQIAILLDSQVVSAPSVNVPITDGRTRIDGNFNVQKANDFANILKVGRLPARLQIIQESVVGPSLGADNIRTSLVAMGVGVALLLLFMVFYYGGAGIVSILALLLNLIFIFAAMASLGTVLTLPGFAGVILTIGMAVDANVIIFERVREELRSGKKIGQAVVDGFANSYSAIIDANVTTFLVAMVLAYFGLGPIKGFAVVLMIGVVSSLFTAVLIGRMMIEYWLGRKKNANLSFWTNSTKNSFANVNIDWMGKRKITYAISGLLLLASLASIFTKGFDLSVDFKGGYSYTVEFDQDIEAEALRQALNDPFGGTPTVKSVDADNTYSIVTDYLVDVTEQVNGQEPQEVVLAALHQGVVAATGQNDLSLEVFGDSEAEGTTHVVSVSKVGPTIADDIRKSSYLAGGLALLLIFLYLLLRFDKWQYSAGAVAALFHDSIIVLGIFSIFSGILPINMELDQAFIAAILTVIGYSINDTVVVFDRIREYINAYTTGNKTEVINAAINSTVSRTVITSLTTLFVVSTLLFFGGASIRGFALALFVGIIVGTYSSIFIATPIVHDLSDEMKPKPVESTSSSKAKKTAKA
ncbi:MAG: protein translocase subunit SecDF [Bacteroidota bacterium]